MFEYINDDISRRFMGTTDYIVPPSEIAPPPEKEPYKVGNKRPPLEHRWRKGKSGNRRGRPRGNVNVYAMLVKVLQRVVTVDRGGRITKITNLEGMLEQAVSSALKKDWRAFNITFALLREGFAKGKISPETGQLLDDSSDDDKAFDWTEEQENLYRELEALERPHVDNEKG
jgi:hypothetical protein